MNYVSSLIGYVVFTNMLLRANNKKYIHIIPQHIDKKSYYMKRWLKVLDLILEIGKRRILGKLRIIQLIETNLQLLICIFIGGQNNNRIK